MIQNNNPMFCQNKINFSSSHEPRPSQSLSALLQSLKQQRSLRLGRQGSSELHSEQPEEPSSPLKDNFSEAAKSLSLNPPLRHSMQEGGLALKYQGDPVLKNRGRMGHANRYTVKQYMIPSQFFNPTKQKLDAHLRFSRILSSENQATPTPANHLQQTKPQSFYDNLSRQAEYSALAQSKVLKKQNIPKNQRLHQLNSDLALKYCMVNKLTPAVQAKQILVFFVRLLQILNFSIPEPKIEKYKDCIFFGFQTKKGNKLQEKERENSPFGHHNEGLLYYFSGSLYMGQLYKNTMHGLGVQIFFRSSAQRLANHVFPAIYTGQFRNGIMKGYFQVKKQGERYSGDVENGVYHGYGRLESEAGKMEGEFRNGKYIGAHQKEKRREERYPQQRHQHQNWSMIQMGDSHHKQRMSYGNQEYNMKDTGIMTQREPYSRSFSNQNRYNVHQLPHSYRKVSNSKLQQLNRKQEELEVDPWSYPSQKQQPHKNVNANEMLEFSYPFGNEIMVEQSTQAYQAPMLRTHNIKKRGEGQNIKERNNPERVHYHQLRNSREGAGKLTKRDQVGTFDRGFSNDYPQFADSDQGQEEPLTPKC